MRLRLTSLLHPLPQTLPLSPSLFSSLAPSRSLFLPSNNEVMMLIGDSTVAILDKVEGNAKLDNSDQPIYGSLFDVNNNT